MNWTTIYISGRPDFREEVRKRLEHTHLKCMPGNIGNNFRHGSDDLYWLDADTDLRTFKLAVGGKLIWKYRLRFFDELEGFLDFQNSQNKTELTADDRLLIDEMGGASPVQA